MSGRGGRTHNTHSLTHNAHGFTQHNNAHTRTHAHPCAPRAAPRRGGGNHAHVFTQHNSARSHTRSHTRSHATLAKHATLARYAKHHPQSTTRKSIYTYIIRRSTTSHGSERQYPEPAQAVPAVSWPHSCTEPRPCCSPAVPGGHFTWVGDVDPAGQ